MTATCPPPLRSEILTALGILDCHVIHAPTDRPEISYRVKMSKNLERAKKHLSAAVRKQLKKAGASFRGLVYCRSKDNVDDIAKELGCDAFHAERPMEERAKSFQDWVEGKNKFMVCSSLMGCGIDVEGVTTVFHFGTPWSILDFVQESGRAGRGGQPSLSVVYAAEDEREPVEDEEGEVLYGKQTMREWVFQTSICRRVTLSSFLDGRRVTCALLRGAILCDVCSEQSQMLHPGRLVEFSEMNVPFESPGQMTLPSLPPISVEYEHSRALLEEDEG
jgi:superfamily II DNA helicase RecQ